MLYRPRGDSGVDFDWLDKRSMDPRYKRINKKTGKEIMKENIVKGAAYEDGQYVSLSDKEIADAYPYDHPDHRDRELRAGRLDPFVTDALLRGADQPRGRKVYAPLREALQRSGRIGVARVVIQTKQHLAAMIPAGPPGSAQPPALGCRHPALG